MVSPHPPAPTNLAKLLTDAPGVGALDHPREILGQIRPFAFDHRPTITEELNHAA